MFNKLINNKHINYQLFIQEDKILNLILILKNFLIWMKYFHIQI